METSQYREYGWPVWWFPWIVVVVIWRERASRPSRSMRTHHKVLWLFAASTRLGRPESQPRIVPLLAVSGLIPASPDPPARPVVHARKAFSFFKHFPGRYWCLPYMARIRLLHLLFNYGFTDSMCHFFRAHSHLQRKTRLHFWDINVHGGWNFTKKWSSDNCI